jgi:hypothetical protein
MRNRELQISACPIYAEELDKQQLTDEFFGKGFEDLYKASIKMGKNLIVGYYLSTPQLEN